MADSPVIPENVEESTSEGPATDGQDDRITLSLDQLRQLINENNHKQSSDDGATANNDISVEEELDDPLSSDEESDETAPAVDQSLVNFLQNRLSVEQPKEKMKVKFDKATRPTNLECTKEVRVNKGLFSSLSIITKKRDYALRKIGSTNQKAINNFAKVADMVIKKGKCKGPKTFTEDEFKEMHSNIINGLGLVCQSTYKVNFRRVRLTISMSPLKKDL